MIIRCCKNVLKWKKKIFHFQKNFFPIIFNVYSLTFFIQNWNISVMMAKSDLAVFRRLKYSFWK